jgi:hypothetical protein
VQAGRLQAGRATYNNAVRIALHDPGAHVDHAIDKIHAALEHFLEKQDSALCLRCQYERHTKQIGRKIRPGAILDFWDGGTEIILHGKLLIGRHMQMVILYAPLHPQLGPVFVDDSKIVRFDVLDREFTARENGRGDKTGGLDRIGCNAVIDAVQAVPHLA